MTSNLEQRLICRAGLGADAGRSQAARASQTGDRAGRDRAVSSGPFAEWGRTNTATLQMLEKQVNDAGGINGAKLQHYDPRRRDQAGAGDQRSAQARRRR